MFQHQAPSNRNVIGILKSSNRDLKIFYVIYDIITLNIQFIHQLPTDNKILMPIAL